LNFEVGVAHEAEKILDRLDRPTEQRVRSRFVHLAVDPFDPQLSTPFVDRPGIRKSRVGGWRIPFTVDREPKANYVLTVDPRASGLQALMTSP
jgi:mRNA interferase RelE/StbE